MSTELCERMRSVLTPEQFEALDLMTNEELRCIGEYGNFVKGNSTDSHSLLLELLKSVTENQGNVGDEDLRVFRGNGLKTVQRRKVVETEESNRKFRGEGAVVSFEICGNGKHCVDPAALQVSKALHRQLTKLVLRDVQVPVEILKKALEPCIVLQDLRLESVGLLSQCERVVGDDGTVAPYAPVSLPLLTSFTFRSSTAESESYSWNKIFFFAIRNTQQVNLEELWKCEVSVMVECGSMILNMDPERQSVLFQVHRKEFFDAPQFVPYIEPESVFGFLEECSGVKSVTFLLPKGFGSIDLCRLSNDVKSMILSGLHLKCSEEQNYFKGYTYIKLLSCTFNQYFLDNVSLLFPAAKRIELEGCRLNNTELANFKIAISS